MELSCRVCGYADGDPPWGKDNRSPSHNICACCGVEHGYEDMTLAGARTFRAKWLAGGAKWFDRKVPPVRLVLKHQLANIPPGWV